MLIYKSDIVHTLQKSAPSARQKRLGLVKKTIVDKTGRRTSVWVKVVAKTEDGHQISQLGDLLDFHTNWAIQDHYNHTGDKDAYVVHTKDGKHIPHDKTRFGTVGSVADAHAHIEKYRGGEAKAKQGKQASSEGPQKKKTKAEVKPERTKITPKTLLDLVHRAFAQAISTVSQNIADKHGVDHKDLIAAFQERYIKQAKQRLAKRDKAPRAKTKTIAVAEKRVKKPASKAKTPKEQALDRAVKDLYKQVMGPLLKQAAKDKGLDYRDVKSALDDVFGAKAEPEVKDPEAKDPEVKEPEVKEPEVKEPEVKEPEMARRSQERAKQRAAYEAKKKKAKAEKEKLAKEPVNPRKKRIAERKKTPKEVQEQEAQAVKKETKRQQREAKEKSEDTEKKQKAFVKQVQSKAETEEKKKKEREGRRKRLGARTKADRERMLAAKAKAQKSDSSVIIGSAPSVTDLIKAKPSLAIKAWAKKMQQEGGEHPFAWCSQKAAKFASDPNAFCAAVHLAAYGKTPSERKADKKG